MIFSKSVLMFVKYAAIRSLIRLPNFTLVADYHRLMNLSQTQLNRLQALMACERKLFAPIVASRTFGRHWLSWPV
jgi:hypothetical protein